MERSVIKQIYDLDRMVKKHMNSVSSDPMNMTQLRIIHYLMKHRQEDVSQKDLENETHLRKASITGALDGLSEKGIIERIQSEKDRRINHIVLTEKALSHERKFLERISELNNLVSKGISEEELSAFFTVSDKLLNNLKEGKDEADI